MTTWVTATVLQALAERELGLGSTFIGTDLAKWVGESLSRDQRINATTALCRLRFVEHLVVHIDGVGRQDQYLITADGAAAIAEAAKGRVRKSGPKLSRSASPLKPDSLVMRLWSLMRMRQMLDSDSAARTLCDAGDDDFKRVRSSVTKYLRRWTTAGALQESARRVNASGSSNGYKRFVLKDSWKRSAEPPAWREIARQTKAAAATEGASE